MINKPKYWVVIPAAGVGLRMGKDKPKQYISIKGKTILEHTLHCFLQRQDIEAIVVTISKEDEYFSKLSLSKDKKIIIAPGGKERFESVFSALSKLRSKADDNDWVLVHDAARPCLSQQAINRLLKKLSGNEVGGILAMPCKDTMKLASSTANEIEKTLNRDKIWHAQTPQMFRYKKLLLALESTIKKNSIVTDEAMAMELSGYKPSLINGNPENIKITHIDDLKHANLYL